MIAKLETTCLERNEMLSFDQVIISVKVLKQTLFVDKLRRRKHMIHKDIS